MTADQCIATLTERGWVVIHAQTYQPEGTVRLTVRRLSDGQWRTLAAESREAALRAMVERTETTEDEA